MQLKKKNSSLGTHFTWCLGKPFQPFFTILNGLKMDWKIVWEMIWKMVWLYKFQDGINGWDLKILYRDLESWKKWLKKVEWNEMVRRIEKSKKIEWNGMRRMVRSNMEWLAHISDSLEAFQQKCSLCLSVHTLTRDILVDLIISVFV